MTIKLLLTNTDDQSRWTGVVDIDGDLFQVTIWPGSMTTDWKASLKPTLFVPLSQGPLETAIIEAKLSLDRGWPKGETLNADQSKTSSLSPELINQILEVLKGS